MKKQDENASSVPICKRCGADHDTKDCIATRLRSPSEVAQENADTRDLDLGEREKLNIPRCQYGVPCSYAYRDGYVANCDKPAIAKWTWKTGSMFVCEKHDRIVEEAEEQDPIDAAARVEPATREKQSWEADGLWRVEINQFSKTADIRSAVRDGDEIIAADLPHYEADRIVTAHNKSVYRTASLGATPPAPGLPDTKEGGRKPREWWIHVAECERKNVFEREQGCGDCILVREVLPASLPTKPIK